MDQRTDDWYAARLGKVTASRVYDVMNKLKNGKPGAGRTRYMMELLTERLAGRPGEFYMSKPMQRGVDIEPVARMAYWMETGREVEEVGFIDHPRIRMCGASPDGTVGTRGLVEIKCPETHTHINFLVSKVIDPKYVWQMHHQMGCTGRQWCDFVSFDDRLPEELSIAIVRVKRNPALLKEMATEIREFLRELDILEKQMRRRMKKAKR